MFRIVSLHLVAILVALMGSAREGAYSADSALRSDTSAPAWPPSGETLSVVTPYHATGGYGTRTEGGVAGRVIRVTTLAKDGPGSLKEALDAAGPRLVVFDVGGVIDLERDTLSVQQPFLTIAGQTAPDPGITIIRGSLLILTHDVVVQHVAVRPGDAGQIAHSGWEPDAINVFGDSSRPAYNVVIDHCSATWGVDENISVSGPADMLVADDAHVTSHDVTLYRCLAAEGLSTASHSKGEHSKGTLLHDSTYNVSIIGCLYAHNRERNARLKGGTRAVIVNSAMYDWGATCVGMGTVGNASRLMPAEAALVGNVVVAGADTTRSVFVHNHDAGARVFLWDNVLLSRTTAIVEADAGIERLDAPPSWPSGLVPRTGLETLADVLRSAGARATNRDAVDARIVESVISRTGRIIDSQEQVGGYPVRLETRRSLAVPDSTAERRAWLDDLASRIGVDPRIDARAMGRPTSP